MKFKTFNEEMEKELKDMFGDKCTGRLEKIPEDEKPTAADYRELERRIALHSQENEAMLAMSVINAKKSIVL